MSLATLIAVAAIIGYNINPIVMAAQRIGVRTLIIAECGHAYPSLRWNPMLRSSASPFDMMYMSEYLGKQAKAGKLRLSPLQGKVTYHDPCKTGRRGGAFEEPRALFTVMRADFVEKAAHLERRAARRGEPAGPL